MAGAAPQASWKVSASCPQACEVPGKAFGPHRLSPRWREAETAPEGQGTPLPWGSLDAQSPELVWKLLLRVTPGWVLSLQPPLGHVAEKAVEGQPAAVLDRLQPRLPACESSAKEHRPVVCETPRGRPESTCLHAPEGAPWPGGGWGRMLPAPGAHTGASLGFCQERRARSRRQVWRDHGRRCPLWCW